MSATGRATCAIEEDAKAAKSEPGNEDHELRHRRLVKSTPSKPTRITLRSAKNTTSTRPAWNSGSPSPTASKAKAPQHTTRTLPRKLPVRAKLPTQEESNYGEQKESPGKDVAATIGGTDMTKEMRRAPTVSELLQVGIEEESFNESDLITSPRLTLPVPSRPQIKCDPAIIVCGPRIADRETLRPEANSSIKISTDSPEKAEIGDRGTLRPENNASIKVSTDSPKNADIGDHLESFRKTLGRLKKVDRKAIRNLLECLKTLNSDEDQPTCPKQPSKKVSRVPSKTSRKSKVPKAPGTFSNIGESPYVTRSFSNDLKGSSVPSPFSNNGILNPLAPAFQNFNPKQEPIWINTFQTPTIIDQEDDDFQEFCRANNFIPLVPVPLGSMKSLTKSYVALKLEPMLPYNIPFGTPTPPTVQESQPQSQSLNLTDHTVSVLEETSEPAEEDGFREAKALDPVWGGQILENFVKKYPMTGRVKIEDTNSQHGVDSKATTTLQKSNLKSERKISGNKTKNRAAEIRQKLEMILAQQREKHAPLVPAHKANATEIQQRLEIMLFMLKEQKALEGFSKRVHQ